MEENVFRVLVGSFCLLFPPFLATKYHEILFSKLPLVSEKKHFITIAAGYLFAMITIISGICMLRNHTIAPYSDLFLTMSNLFKYNLLTGGLAIALPNILYCGCILFISGDANHNIPQKNGGQKDEIFPKHQS